MPNDPSTDGGDGKDSKLLWWLLGLLTAVVISVIGAWTHAEVQRLDKLEDRFGIINDKLDDVRGRLVRIETKVDAQETKR